MNNYLKKLRREKIIVLISQIVIISSILILWQVLTDLKILNSFLVSSPLNIIITIKNMFLDYNLVNHILTTIYEVIISFVLGISLGFIIAIILYQIPILYKIIDPFLTMLNSMPKVALGPIIIIWAGANVNSIITMALLINLIVSIISIYNGFINTDKNKIRLLKSFNASKLQILYNLVIPSSYTSIISSLKINIGLTLIGVVMGEFLVSRQGIGYLIIYGTQIFNLNIVMSGIIILVIISYLIYKIIEKLEQILLNKE